MGIKQSLEAETELWRDQDWQPLFHQTLAFGKTRTLQNIRNGSLADQYQSFWLNNQEYEFYLKSFNWRSKKSNHFPIVSSIGLKILNGEGPCGGKLAANVYLQHIGVRLCQIDQIPLSDALYIILTALEGYQHLYEHAGYFRVEQEQICIDRVGRVKVWVNKDLSMNYPECDQESEGLRRNQTHMVRQLVDIVEQNIDQDQMLQLTLSSYLSDIKRNQRHEIGFEYAQTAVLEYAQKHNLMIPNRIDAATELYRLNFTPNNNLSILSEVEPLNQKSQHILQRQYLPTNIISAYQSTPNLHSYNTNNSINSKISFQSQVSNQYQNRPLPYQTPLVRFNTQIPQNIPTQQQMNIPPQYIMDNNINKSPSVTTSPPAAPKLAYQTAGQLPSISKRTARTQSHIACLQQTTENQSMQVQQGDDRNTMKSMPVRDPNTDYSERGPQQEWIRYSQFITPDRHIPQYTSFQINQDAFGFGLGYPNRRRIRESTSSYRIPSSNSSRKFKRVSQRGSSRRQSYLGSANDQFIEGRRYFVGLGDYNYLDPQIQADMIKYLG